MKPSLSVIIITKNNAGTIEKCLKSVAFADEIIIFDSGSTDATLSLCQHYTSRLFQTDWPGFGEQKNRALNEATGDWVFSIDSDEWMSDALREKIIAMIQNPTHLVFQMPRCNQYCGQWMRYGDVGRDKVIRLFKRGCAKFNNNIVHENIETREKIGFLSAPIMHRAYESIEELLLRMNKYSSLSADLRFQKGKKTSLLRAILSARWIFIRAYFFRLGFLDGQMGYIVATAAAQSSYYRHVKLLMKHQHATISPH